MLLFCSFAGGIILTDQFSLSFNAPFYSLIFFVIFLGLEISGRLMNRLFGVFLFFFCFLLGSSVAQLNTFKTEQWGEKGVNPGNAVFGVRLNEVSQGESEWVKCVGLIEKVYSQTEVQSAEIPLLLFIKQTKFTFLKGDQILISSEVESIRNKGNPGEFDAEKYWKGKGIAHISFVGERDYKLVDHVEQGVFDRFTDQLRTYCSSALNSLFGGQEGAVLSAIVLGDKSHLTDEIRNSFMNTGAMHVLAVSGLHVGLILYLLLFIAERFSKFISRRSALIGILIFLWIYAVITGLSPSVVRAVFMFSMLSVSQLISREYDSINILFFTAFCLLLYEPLYLYDIGFQLSYLAMLGIFLFYDPIQTLIQPKNKLLSKIWQGTAIGLAAQIMTTPFSLYYFHQFPNYFILSNIGLMATSGVILGLGIAVLALYKLSFLIKPIVLFLWTTLFVTIGFLSWVEQLPGAVAYGYDLTIWQGSILIFGCFLLFFSKSRKIRFYGAVPLVLISILWITSDRYDRMSSNEVCIFSHNRPLIALKSNGKIFCFYQGKTDKDREKAEMIVASYAKQFPGEIEFHEFSNKAISLSNHQIEFNLIPMKEDVSLEINSKEYSLVLKNEMQTMDFLGAYRIGMPWVEKSVDHSLKDGAFRIRI